MHPRAHVAAVVRAALIEHDELLGRLDGQLPQQHLVDQREDGGIGANPQGEREDGDNRKERAPPESAQGKAQVTR